MNPIRTQPIKPEPLRFLRLPELLSRRSTSSSATYRHIAAGILPPPVKLGPNTSGWPEHEIEAVDRARLGGASEDEVRKLVLALVKARKSAA